MGNKGFGVLISIEVLVSNMASTLVEGNEISKISKIPWRRKWQPTPVFLPGKSHGQRSLAGYCPWGCRVRHDLATKQHHNRVVTSEVTMECIIIRNMLQCSISESSFPPGLESRHCSIFHI